MLYQHGTTRALFIGASSNQNQRNHKSQSESKGKYREEPIRLKVKTSKLPKARENAVVHVAIDEF